MDLRQELSSKVLFWGRNLRQQAMIENIHSEMDLSQSLLNFFFKVKRFTSQKRTVQDFQLSSCLHQHAGHPLLLCLILQNLATLIQIKTQLLQISDSYVLQFNLNGYPYFVAPNIACGFLTLNDFQKLQKKNEEIALRTHMIHSKDIADLYLKEIDFFLPEESTHLRLHFLDLKILLYPMDSGSLIRRALLKGSLGYRKEAFLDFKKASYISRFDKNPSEVQNYFKELSLEFGDLV